jgi:hypothetical protein
VKSQSTRFDGLGWPKRLRDGGAAPPTTDDALDAEFGHQPLDGAAGHLVPLASKLFGSPPALTRVRQIRQPGETIEGLATARAAGGWLGRAAV